MSIDYKRILNFIFGDGMFKRVIGLINFQKDIEERYLLFVVENYLTEMLNIMTVDKLLYTYRAEYSNREDYIEFDKIDEKVYVHIKDNIPYYRIDLSSKEFKLENFYIKDIYNMDLGTLRKYVNNQYILNKYTEEFAVAKTQEYITRRLRNIITDNYKERLIDGLLELLGRNEEERKEWLERVLNDNNFNHFYFYEIACITNANVKRSMSYTKTFLGVERYKFNIIRMDIKDEDYERLVKIDDHVF